MGYKLKEFRISYPTGQIAQLENTIGKDNKESQQGHTARSGNCN